MIQTLLILAASLAFVSATNTALPVDWKELLHSEKEIEVVDQFTYKQNKLRQRFVSNNGTQLLTKGKVGRKVKSLDVDGTDWVTKGYMVITDRVNQKREDNTQCGTGFVQEYQAWGLGLCLAHYTYYARNVNGRIDLAEMYYSDVDCRDTLLVTNIYDHWARECEWWGSGNDDHPNDGMWTSSYRITTDLSAVKAVKGFGYESYNTFGDCQRGEHPYQYYSNDIQDSCQEGWGKHHYKAHCNKGSKLHWANYGDKWCTNNLLGASTGDLSGLTSACIGPFYSSGGNNRNYQRYNCNIDEDENTEA